MNAGITKKSSFAPVTLPTKTGHKIKEYNQLINFCCTFCFSLSTDINGEDGGEGQHQLEHLIAALRSDVELIVVKLLGVETIDYAHIGKLFDDDQCKCLRVGVLNVLHALPHTHPPQP